MSCLHARHLLILNGSKWIAITLIIIRPPFSSAERSFLLFSLSDTPDGIVFLGDKKNKE